MNPTTETPPPLPDSVGSHFPCSRAQAQDDAASPCTPPLAKLLKESISVGLVCGTLGVSAGFVAGAVLFGVLASLVGFGVGFGVGICWGLGLGAVTGFLAVFGSFGLALASAVCFGLCYHCGCLGKLAAFATCTFWWLAELLLSVALVPIGLVTSLTQRQKVL
mmetsp:Transcript_25990/g.65292  ORF Transcript_25990/g.65292 Transcript_25990/m.65292 type:complete len:163 (-) Transcript_25990:371-859(-)